MSTITTLHWLIVLLCLSLATLSIMIALAESLILALLSHWPALAPLRRRHTILRRCWRLSCALWLLVTLVWMLIIAGLL